MSPEAVTQRLRLMDELWELSVKLMNSKPAPKNIQSPKDSALEIQRSIQKVLFYDWDPIGVSKYSSWDSDEYDAYIAPVYRILVGTRSEEDIIDRLYQIERDTIGSPRRDPELLRPVAKKLLELDIRQL